MSVFLFIILLALTGFNLITQGRNNQSKLSSSPYFTSAALSLPKEPQLIDQLPLLNHFEPLDLDVYAAQVFNLKHSYPVFEINAGQRWPLASLTKLMTAVIALEHLSPDQIVLISETAAASPGRTNDLSSGGEFTVDDLIKAMMVVSSNSAATALSETLPKGEFVRLMNKKATELGMQNTYFFDSSGLSFLNQSTPTDLIRLVKHIYYQHPSIWEASARRRVRIIEKQSGRRQTLLNINQFAGRTDFLGGKTGFIDKAQGNLVSIFRINRQPVSLIVFGALGFESRFVETEKLLDFIYDSRRNY